MSDLADFYESTTFEAVHAGVLDLLPSRPGEILDVGAGSGRDAAWMAARGQHVTAVEPSQAMLREARRRHPDTGVYWLRDELPGLSLLDTRKFDLIIVSAVWMFIPHADRPAAMVCLSQLLSDTGKLVLTAKIGVVDRHRGMEPTDADDILTDAIGGGLQVERTLVREDALGRPDACWWTFVFEPRAISLLDST